MKLMINVRLEENVVVTEGFTQKHLSKIQAVSEDFDIVVPQTVEETQSEIRDTDIVFGDFSRGDVRRGAQSSLGPVHRIRHRRCALRRFRGERYHPYQRQGDRRNPPGRPRLGFDPGSYQGYTHCSQGEDVECPDANPSPVMGTGGDDSWGIWAWEALVSRWRVGPRASGCEPSPWTRKM